LHEDLGKEVQDFVKVNSLDGFGTAAVILSTDSSGGTDAALELGNITEPVDLEANKLLLLFTCACGLLSRGTGVTRPRHVRV